MRLCLSLAALSLTLATGAAAADEEPLLDYRDRSFLMGSAFYTQSERRQVAAALEAAPDGLGKALGEHFVMLGDADGAFTAPGRRERVYLVQKKAPLAIQSVPDGPPPVLVVLRDGKTAGIHRLGADVQYQRLVAAVDGNGDGRDDVLLETSFMNMGQMVVSLDAVTLAADGAATVIQTLPDVYTDACDNPAGARTRHAATITAGKEGFVAQLHELGCD